MGRSGTKFLSSIMDRSVYYNVKHEPLSKSKENLHRAQQRFYTNQNYGEVNSLLRKWFMDLHVPSKGIIIRNPKDITLSSWNKKKRPVSWLLDDLKPSLELLDHYHKHGAYTIYFDVMTTDKDYLLKVLADFGITDVQITDDDLKTKINGSDYRTTWENLPATFRQTAENIIEPFICKYYG